MGDFMTAMLHTLGDEGGWANNPNDLGKATNHGISLRWLRTVMPEADENTIRHMTTEGAISLYRRHFWEPYPYYQIVDQKVCTKVFNTAVNMGPPSFNKTDPPWAHIILQRALRACGALDVVEDGIFGPKTLDAVNRVQALQLLGKYVAAQSDRYREIARNNPSQAGFLPTWLARARWPLGNDQGAA